jgi:HAD superfamily hydrolase (TIGR01490 family)
MALVLVDVDGTLLQGPSSEPAFVWYLFRHGLLGSRQMMAATWFFIHETWRYGRHVGKKNKAYLSGLAIDNVRVWAETYVQQHLVHQLRPSLLRRLAEHGADGDRVVLLTGTPEFIAEPLARRIGVDNWLATRCPHRDGCYIAGSPVFHPFDDGKVTAAEEFCRSLGLLLRDCIAYGDSRYDLRLLMRVARAVVVKPDAILAARARSSGWEILEDAPDNDYSAVIN